MSTSRDELRSRLLATKRPKSMQVEFFGETLEIRQPALKDILDARDNSDRNAAVIQILTKYTYIPGTDERVFEDGDADALLNMPFGNDFMGVTKALESLTAVNFLEQSQSSGQTQPLGGSSGSVTA